MTGHRASNLSSTLQTVGAKRAGWGESLVTSGEDTAGNGRVLAFFVADGGVAMATEVCGGTAVGEEPRRVLDVDLAELQWRAGALARELGHWSGIR